MRNITRVGVFFSFFVLLCSWPLRMRVVATLGDLQLYEEDVMWMKLKDLIHRCSSTVTNIV